MNNTKFVLSIVLSSTVLASQSAIANVISLQEAENTYTATVTDVTEATEALEAFAQPTPEPLLPAPGGDLPEPGGVLPLPGGNDGGGLGSGFGCNPLLDPFCQNPTGGFDLSTILTVGQKIWDFIVTNKPNAEYQTLKASVLPGGATNFAQLKGWSKPVSKVYHVEFKNLFGKSGGGFDYRIVFIYGGNYQGKGKYIGQISFAPLNVNLKTDRQLNVKAELLEPLNYGTEEDPVAAAQLLITWHSPTTLRYTMNSVEYFLYGTGEIQDISNGTPAH